MLVVEGRIDGCLGRGLRSHAKTLTAPAFTYRVRYTQMIRITFSGTRKSSNENVELLKGY